MKKDKIVPLTVPKRLDCSNIETHWGVMAIHVFVLFSCVRHDFDTRHGYTKRNMFYHHFQDVITSCIRVALCRTRFYVFVSWIFRSTYNHRLIVSSWAPHAPSSLSPCSSIPNNTIASHRPVFCLSTDSHLHCQRSLSHTNLTTHPQIPICDVPFFKY